MRRRFVIALAERVDTQQLELAAELRELDLLDGRLPGTGTGTGDDDDDDEADARSTGEFTTGPTCRRRLADLDPPEERIELPEPGAGGLGAAHP